MNILAGYITQKRVAINKNMCTKSGRVNSLLIAPKHGYEMYTDVEVSSGGRAVLYVGNSFQGFHGMYRMVREIKENII